MICEIVNDPGKYDLTDREIGQATTVYNTLQEVFKTNPEVEDAITRISGKAVASIGIHAGGVVISSKKIGEHIPLMKGSDTAVLSMCQTDMSGIEFYRGLKLDCLGLGTLSQIALCMELAGIPEEWYYDEDDEDEKVYEHLRKGFTTNVFQMYKYTPTMMIKDFKVKDLNGLTAVNAGNRPGPLAKGEDGKSMVDRYIEVVNSGEIPKIHPEIDPILEDTNGQLWYQEQCQKIGQVMAGYTLGMADNRIRRVIAKKKTDLIPEVRNEFIYGKKSLYDKDGKVIGVSDEDSPNCIGAIRNGFEEKLALRIFSSIEAFATYCFNRSHSCTYALVGYKTAWLSLYYPVEWAVACLTTYATDNNAEEKITATLNDCKKRKIKILPPDINTSDKGFTVAKLPDGTKGVRYGFLGVKDVGANVSEIIRKLVEIDGPFKSLEDFLNRTLDTSNETLLSVSSEYGLVTNTVDKKGKEVLKLKNAFSKRNIVPLILSGAFDELEENRYKLCNQYFDFRKDKCDRYDEDSYCLKDKLEHELNLLGYYVSQHPLDGEMFPYFDTTTAIDNQRVEFAGILKSYSTAKTKRGEKFYKLKLELKDGSIINVNIFKNTYLKYPDSIKGLSSSTAKEGKEIFFIKGKYSVKYNNVTASKAFKLSDMNNKEDKRPDLSDDVPDLETQEKIKDSLIDEDLFIEGSIIAN